MLNTIHLINLQDFFMFSTFFLHPVRSNDEENQISEKKNFCKSFQFFANRWEIFSRKDIFEVHEINYF